MQLFNNKKKTANFLPEPSQDFVMGRISGYRVIICSKRARLIDEIRAMLFLYNVLTIETASLVLTELKEDSSWSNHDVIIFDIEDFADAESLSEQVNRCIPIQATTILVGGNDSIVFADVLLKKGIHFILERQLDKIPHILHARSITPPGSSKRVGSVVSFLSCKGGVGASSLIAHIVKNISEMTNYPILYIQGATTSPNADFLFEQPINDSGELTRVNNSLQVKIERNASVWKYDDLNSGQFNISVIDQNMGLSSSLNHLNEIMLISNVVILVINRDPYSIRVAKTILEEIARSSLKDVEYLNKRFLVCLNESAPVDKKSSLQDEDIEEFIGRKIDFVRKYIANKNKFDKASNSPEIKAIASSIIGKEAVSRSINRKSFSLGKLKLK